LGALTKRSTAAGTQFTCFTSTNVQILAPNLSYCWRVGVDDTLNRSCTDARIILFFNSCRDASVIFFFCSSRDAGIIYERRCVDEASWCEELAQVI
jgi:hypothetical protein